MPSIKHGHSIGGHRTPTYNTWECMRRRCTDPLNRDYASYGKRGIAVCERWRDFAAFLADMGERPEGMSIERKDTNGDYEPNNCRWATQKDQQNNRRDNHALTLGGTTMNLGQWSIKTGLPESTIRKRLELGWSIERALAQPRRASALPQR